MSIRKLFQAGMAGLALGGTKSEGVVHEALKDDDTELVHGRHHYRGNYYGGGYYRSGFSVSYYGGGWGGYSYPRYYGGWGYSTYYPTYYYSVPSFYYYSAPACYYGISGQLAPTVNLGNPTPSPMAAPQPIPQPMPTPQQVIPAPAAPKAVEVETLKVSLPGSRTTMKFPAFGDK